MLSASSHDRCNHPEDDLIAIAFVHTAFLLHADIHQDLYAELPEDSEMNEDGVWKIHKVSHGFRRAPRLWHQHVVTTLERLNFHSHLTDPSCFRNDSLNINVSIQVDDGLLFGWNSEL